MKIALGQSFFRHLPGISLRQMKSHFVGGEPVVREVPRRRYGFGRVLGPFVFLKIRVRSIGEIIELLRLPGKQTLRQVRNGQPVGRRGYLLWKDGRVAGEIEGFCGDDARCLMIIVIFAGHVGWKPRENHFGPGEAH